MTKPAQQGAENEVWTVLRLLQWTTDYFRKRGNESPRLEAEVLLAHALQCSRIELYTAFESQPTAEQRGTFRELVRRRGEGVPVAYLVGYREFYSLKFTVTPAVLIPRPETEHLIIEALNQAKRLAAADLGRPLRIVDVGTGSGAIAITVAKHLATAYPAGGQITAVDLSPEALAVAEQNATDLEVDPPIHWVQGDLLEPLPNEPDSLDLVLSNPPYVSQSEYSELALTVREHEPQGALVSGPTGTELIEKLIQQAGDRLIVGGALIVELSPMIAAAVAKLVQADGRYSNAHFIKDLAGHQRILSVTRQH